jgi:hypothetical protein
MPIGPRPSPFIIFTRLENTHGKHNKFYEVAVDNTGHVTRRWGAIGAPRGSATYEKDDDHQATIDKKIGGGYVVTERFQLEPSAGVENRYVSAWLDQDLDAMIRVFAELRRERETPAGPTLSPSGPPKPAFTDDDAPTPGGMSPIELADRAKWLIPRVVDDPHSHLPEYVAIKEEADKNRKALAQLDGHLQMLEAVLTRR